MTDFKAPGKDSYPVGLLSDPVSLSKVLDDLKRQQVVDAHLETQRESLLKIMREWDDLIMWVSTFPRKYLPKTALEEKLRSLRPF